MIAVLETPFDTECWLNVLIDCNYVYSKYILTLEIAKEEEGIET